MSYHRKYAPPTDPCPPANDDWVPMDASPTRGRRKRTAGKSSTVPRYQLPDGPEEMDAGYYEALLGGRV